jgi:hypothetical protein
MWFKRLFLTPITYKLLYCVHEFDLDPQKLNYLYLFIELLFVKIKFKKKISLADL